MNPRTARIGRSMASPFNKRAPCFCRGDDYLEIFDDAHSDDEDRVHRHRIYRKGPGSCRVYGRDEETVRLIQRPLGDRAWRLTCIGAMSKEVRYDRHS